MMQSRTTNTNGKCQCKLRAVMLGHDDHPQPRNDNCESPSCWMTIVSRKQDGMCTGMICQKDFTSAVASRQRLSAASEIYSGRAHTDMFLNELSKHTLVCGWRSWMHSGAFGSRFFSD